MINGELFRAEHAIDALLIYGSIALFIGAVCFLTAYFFYQRKARRDLIERQKKYFKNL